MKAEIYPIDNVPFGRLAIMPRPRAGDWLPGEVESWRQAGVNCIVSLLEPAEIVELELQHEPDICRQLDLEFVAFPIPDRGVPLSGEELKTLVSSLVFRLRGGSGVAIHCRIGVGRSALVAACVIASMGQTLESAWKSIEKARGLSVPDTPNQRAWVATLCAKSADWLETM
jgi:protein-tyrosine phosphatase